MFELNESLSNLLRRFVKSIGTPGVAIVASVSAGLIFPLIITLSYDNDLNVKVAIFFILVIVLVSGMELFFRLGYRFYMGLPYQKIPRVPFEKIYVEPHPYIPYVMKRNFTTEKGGAANYPLHKGKFFFGQYTTNNVGFANGIKGDRDMAIPKPDGLYRINCIGASTTGNYIEYDGQVFSYPLELEKNLKATMAVPVEVNNCGQGGYNSADIMIRFALQVLDTKPDIVVIYHAYNDIRAYLTPGLRSDYSHVRRNLGETYWKFALAAKMPRTGLAFVDYFFNKLIAGDVRNSLLDQVTKGNVDLSNDYSVGLSVYKRNLQYIIDLCRSEGIQVVVSTYCHYLHEAIKDEPQHILYGRIVREENEIMRYLADRNGLKLVDNAELVPRDERYFVDSIHFTPAGMQLIAGNIADAIRRLPVGH